MSQEEAEGEHQRPNEDGAETGAGDDSQEHRGGPKAPHPGVFELLTSARSVCLFVGFYRYIREF